MAAAFPNCDFAFGVNLRFVSRHGKAQPFLRFWWLSSSQLNAKQIVV